MSAGDTGKLAENIAYFARALRRAGLPVGPGRVVDAVRAVQVAGFSERQDFYNILQACFVSRPEQRLLFGQTFRLFWRDPAFLDHMMAMLRPIVRGANPETEADAAARRAAEALLDQPDESVQTVDGDASEELEFDASLTFSQSERLAAKDFEQMTGAEAADARAMIARLRLPVAPIHSRRMQPALAGRQVDGRATLRAALRRGGEFASPARRMPRQRWPNLVCLCDISGSMESYSRMVLHFLHAVSNAKGQGWARVHAFTFGTRLTNITRHLHQRDVDTALAAAGREAMDWQGGTRIGACLDRFNRDWARRVLGQGAVVLLITDGLDRDDAGQLARAAERLQLSARQVVWLNPLLRWDGFAPKASGVRALLPQVDRLYSIHNINALKDLAAAISDPRNDGQKARLLKQMQAA